MLLKVSLAAVLLIAAGLAISSGRFRERGAAMTDRQVRIAPPHTLAKSDIDARPVLRYSTIKAPRVYRRPAVKAHADLEHRIVLRLPYSNDAIETGTDTTIRVSMSQTELLSLGFPIGANAQDRRIAAELTLGDDGLPRAISLPLPIEVVKEKR